MKYRYLLLILLLTGPIAESQFKPHAASGEIRLKLKKLRTLGSVLYIAAHPDDENTLAIGYYANEQRMTTAYLSLTRGDGGQNLIGGELRDKLGLIRTQELLAARRTDGGIQFFTRANDFGFSKGPEETLSIWDKEAILHDVLKVIRSFKPDIIICRFPPDSRAGHGHHTSSALLALEAFDKADDPTVFPEQVNKYGLWKPRRVFLNVSRFFNQNINESTPGVVTIDMGGFNSLLGVSYPELSATSRSMHKSQGFGSRARRGYSPEFFELQRGDAVKKDLLEGINTSWTRISGGKNIDALIQKAQQKFNDDQPWLIIPDLLQIRKSLRELPPGVWKDRKQSEIDDLLRDCLGLYTEITADHYFQSPGKTATLTIEIQNRSGFGLLVNKIVFPELASDTLLNKPVGAQHQMVFSLKRHISESQSLSPPYWLKEKHKTGLFTVSDPELIGLPENPPALTGKFSFTIQGQVLELMVPVLYKWTDPVRGEVYRPVEITPPVSVEPRKTLELFPSQQKKKIIIDIRALAAGKQEGKLWLEAPSDWKVTPSQIDFTLERRGALVSHEFEITPPADSGEGLIRIQASIDGKAWKSFVEEIRYDHIPVQTLQPPSEIRLIREPIQTQARRVGYVEGAGDEVAVSLRSLGVEIVQLKNEEISAESLKDFDAIVLGIRALNANPEIRSVMPELLRYCESGGTLILQYNTSGDVAVERFAPYSLTLSRERVTEENAEVRLLAPAHPALQFPNQITAKDFDDWVQERGLYFPGKWDPAFIPLLSMNDKNEPERNGSLLVAKYGKGHYVYTGLSFFRQLPEGVPGAYKLFANLLSLRNTPK